MRGEEGSRELAVSGFSFGLSIFRSLGIGNPKVDDEIRKQWRSIKLKVCNFIP